MIKIRKIAVLVLALCLFVLPGISFAQANQAIQANTGVISFSTTRNTALVGAIIFNNNPQDLKLKFEYGEGNFDMQSDMLTISHLGNGGMTSLRGLRIGHAYQYRLFDTTGVLAPSNTRTFVNDLTFIPDSNFYDETSNWDPSTSGTNQDTGTGTTTDGTDVLSSTYNLTMIISGDHPAGSYIQANVEGGNCVAEDDEGVSCVIPVQGGTNVIVTASSASDAIFVGWRGNCASTSTSCILKMDRNREVIASFNRVSIVGSSSGGGNTNSTGNTSNTTSGSSSSSGQANTGNKTNCLPPSGGLVPDCPEAGCGFNELICLINNVIQFILFRMAVPIAAIMFAYAGILLLFSGGDTSKRSKAKSIFTNVAIGLIIAIAAWLIVETILTLLGYDQSWTTWLGF
ncbi:hypothetical protein KKA39_02210 [Patescibacteria group bacterium]|nr:hypothetical protein [Patescibacteria group bacterium]MBU1728098.1 hypothetical protein [Patescibacteria group bacterium]